MPALPASADGSEDPRSFSVVLGGPLYQLLRRAHMTDDALHLVRRRILVICAIAWMPLLLLAIAGGDALDGAVAVPFLKDIEVHVRFLVAMPLLIEAELLVHLRLRPVAGEFLARNLIGPESRERFDAALRSAMRMRNSILAEIAMIAVVYALGIPVVWRAFTALDVATWYAHASAQGTRLTPAGVWYVYASVPLFQFLLLRWYFRIIVWMRFLWQVSRIPLNLSAMHADRMGGVGFLANTVFAFVPLAMAHGALVAGTVANRIFHLGAQLSDSAVEIVLVVAFLLLLVLGPLTVFAPQVAAAKRTALRLYGRLSQRYVGEFEGKWLPDGMPARESPLGSGDIQSLADLSNSMETVKSTGIVPITRQSITIVVLATLLPIAPLLLTVIPAKDLAKQLLMLVI
ncbi:MAG TPA: hypothetical protein VGI14_16240 [Casimicrobiaceae bacterium]|jgi:hypothetical protein